MRLDISVVVNAMPVQTAMSGCYSSKLSRLEQLEELNLSGNKLKTIPSTVSSCKRLHTLIAHSNHITVFPEILNLPEIKVRGLLASFAPRLCSG